MISRGYWTTTGMATGTGLMIPWCWVCKLFDSSHSKPYSVDQVIGQDIRTFLAPDILASKHGWLILCWNKPSSTKFVMSYFLFSPLTKQIITLPDLDHSFSSLVDQSYRRTHIVTFSTSNPCSPDRGFFVVLDYHPGAILISTCHARDMSWTTQAFEAQPAPVEAVVFAGGFLYCLFCDNGALAAFSVANRDWSLVTTSSNLGGLSSGRAWVAKTSFLANQALFLDRTSSFSVSASGETSNKVYYYDQDGTLRFYSFDNGKNHALEGSPYAGWLAATGWIL
ncbi:hypothetical protein C3L33_11986, partial [Rhododendron williamsianum]